MVVRSNLQLIIKVRLGLVESSEGRKILPKIELNSLTFQICSAIVVPNSHPYQAGLLMALNQGTGLCGGSVLSDRAILTAAHCPFGSTSTQVILGAHQLTGLEVTQQRLTVPASRYRIHPNYDFSTFHNDIAILITPSAFTLNSFVSVVSLPALGVTDQFAGQLATVTGWGRTSDGSSATSAQLQSVQNNIITNEVCHAVYGPTVIPSTICMATTGGRGTCGGDSGSPLTIALADNQVQVGIVSFGSTAGCERGFPAGFARITSFRQWIISNQNP